MPLSSDGTGYNVVARSNGTFDVEVIKPGDLPEMVRGFTSEREADSWIMERIERPIPQDLPDITTIRP